MRAHPRSRGENSERLATPTTSSGSSPLTRGKPRLLAGQGHLPRLIPAHAGKTRRRRRTRRWMRAHPRSRGENVVGPGALPSPVGSSPLTRGKPCAIGSGLAYRGLIPAHAGKTYRRARRRPNLPAHPRSHGENPPRKTPTLTSSGSSPLTRGKRSCGRSGRAWVRLIPAHAGKTGKDSSAPLSAPAHPRSRGENQVASSVLIDVVGSSPLTRGKLSDEGERRKGARLIPAHAGKTRRRSSASTESEAHPRSRGENTPSRHASRLICGSSPLTRGKPHRSPGWD